MMTYVRIIPVLLLAAAAAAHGTAPTDPPDYLVLHLKLSAPGIPRAELKQIEDHIAKVKFLPRFEWKGEAIGRVKQQLQQRGYFKAEIASSRFGEPSRRDSGAAGLVAVSMAVRPGPRYRLSEIRIRSQSAFTAAELRALFQMKNGDVFDTERVRLGLDRLRQLYGTRGYINVFPTPEIAIDDPHHTISLNINVDEGQVYRIAELQLLGIDDDQKISLLSEVAPGTVYNSGKFEAALKSWMEKNPGWEASTDYRRNDEAATITITLDFRRVETPSRR
jgi:outer membrane translocation and assembly module TamA